MRSIWFTGKRINWKNVIINASTTFVCVRGGALRASRVAPTESR